VWGARRGNRLHARAADGWEGRRRLRGEPANGWNDAQMEACLPSCLWLSSSGSEGRIGKLIENVGGFDWPRLSGAGRAYFSADLFMDVGCGRERYRGMLLPIPYLLLASGAVGPGRRDCARRQGACFQLRTSNLACQVCGGVSHSRHPTITGCQRRSLADWVRPSGCDVVQQAARPLTISPIGVKATRVAAGTRILDPTQAFAANPFAQ